MITEPMPATLAWPGERSSALEVPSPFRVAGPGILTLLESDPEAGAERLSQAVLAIRELIDRAGSKGIVYLLFGATPDHMSPMMYGGHFLELDRQILSGAKCNRLVFVVGGPGVYLDFVSDLPAEAFGWDVKASGISVSEMRAMRTGALAAADPDADLRLITDVPDLTDYLENRHFAL
jgi:hypothetical protein